MNLVLIGLPASGKTTVGAMAAQRLGVAFTDTDALVEARSGQSVQEIFAEAGEPRFRELEQQAVAEALSTSGVVSLGGGAIMSPAVRGLLAGHRVVWLDVSVTTLTRRAGMNRLRPLLLGDVRARLTQLAAERRPFYEAAATCRIDGEQPVDAVVSQVLDCAANVRAIRVASDHPYDVRIGRGIAERVGGELAGVGQTAIFHPGVLSAQAAGLAALVPGPLLVEVPAGESAKTTEVLVRSWRTLAGAGFTRSDAVIGLGGGATTDLAGFVAATLLRGIAFVTVPTTVLGMTDAAVGGKTGINLPEGKNLAGAFYEPRAVFCDLDLLSGLPLDEVRSGLAEVVKHGFIADPAILQAADRDPAGMCDTGSESFAESLTRAIRVKADVVSQDFRERGTATTVGREALNYGHTLGHAIEQVEGFTWAHGYAVSVGMVFAAEVGARLGLIGAAEVAYHRDLLSSLGLPVTYSGAPWATVRAVMGRDKKARGAHLRLVLLDGIGRVRVEADVDEAILAESYQAVGGSL